MSDFNLEKYLQELEKSPTIEDCKKVPVPVIQKDQNYIFVSYSHADYKQVYFDLAHLYCRGVRFWYDQGLSAGEDWEREVKEHIQDPHCCGVIFYLSTNMFLSKSVFKEIEFTTAKKRPNIILQKNYFCVNLQNSNISDMLYTVQEYQRSNGLPRLDTKKLNILTATFSDDDTYIKYNSSHHVDELEEQIKRKFDVTGNSKGDSVNTLELDAIKNPRIALFVYTTKETDPVPLFKFLRADFKKTKKLRPWYLFPVGTVAGLAAAMAMIHRIWVTPDIPYVSELIAAAGAPMLFGFTAAFSFLFAPYATAKNFWLFYISPLRHKAERNLVSKIALFLAFLFATALLSMFAVPICFVAVYITEYVLAFLGL